MQKYKQPDSYLKEMLCKIQVRYTISKIIESNRVDQKQALLFHDQPKFSRSLSAKDIARGDRKVLR